MTAPADARVAFVASRAGTVDLVVTGIEDSPIVVALTLPAAVDLGVMLSVALRDALARASQPAPSRPGLQ